MRANGLDSAWNLLFGEAELPQQRRHFFHGVGHMVPNRQRRGVFRAMPMKYAQVVHPRGRVQHIVIISLALRQILRQTVEPGLVSEFIRRPGLSEDVLRNDFAVAWLI